LPSDFLAKAQRRKGAKKTSTREDTLKVFFAPLRLCGRKLVSLNSSPAGHEINNQHNHSYHEQQVDKAATNIRKQANQPQDQQNNQNCPQHVEISFLILSQKPERRFGPNYRKQPENEQRPCQPSIHDRS
jgi:hypothetical protein